MSPLAPAVLVLEKTPRWESELKRRIAGPNLLVRPCRSSADILSLCRQASGSVIVIDFAAGAADCLRLLETLDRKRLHALPIVVATTAQLDLEWPARELGAAAFVSDTIGGAALAALCQRMLASGTVPITAFTRQGAGASQRRYDEHHFPGHGPASKPL